MAEARSFFELDRYHRRLAELFFQHQAALLDFDWPAALQRFDLYAAAQRLHIRHEESLMLPIFERTDAYERWPAKVYYNDHRKIDSFLTQLRERLAEAAKNGTREKKTLLEILEQETAFKHLCEHHETREEKDFFPTLDNEARDDERLLILERCRKDWQQKVENAQGDEIAYQAVPNSEP